MMILGFNQSKEMTQFAPSGEDAIKIMKKCFENGDYHKYSLILLYSKIYSFEKNLLIVVLNIRLFLALKEVLDLFYLLK